MAAVLLVGTAVVTSLWRRAEASAATARAHLRDSDRSFRQAHGAVDKYYVKLYASGVLNKPGLESVRSEIMRNALDYYRDFLARRGQDRELRAEAAEAGLRAGLMLVDGGDKREGAGFLDRARPLFEGLARDRPAHRVVRRKLGQCNDKMGIMLQRTGQTAEAVAAHRRATDAYRWLVEADHQDPFWRRLLGHVFGNLANTHALAGAKPEALAAYARAREQIDALVRLDPADVGYRTDLAMTINNMALVAETPDNARLLREALTLREALASERPDAGNPRRNVARTRHNLAMTYCGLGRYDEALTLFDSSCAAFRAIYLADQDRLQTREELGEARMRRGEVLLDLGRPADAVGASAEALEPLEAIARLDPENSITRAHLANAYLISARALEGTGRLDEALRCRRARLLLIERFARDLPGDTVARADMEEERKPIEALLRRLGGDGTRG